MKAKELMIGDWVRVLDDPNEEYVFMTRIEDDFCGYYSTYEKCTYSVENDNIEPIPITPEILEKNGFKHIYLMNGINNIISESWEYGTHEHPVNYVMIKFLGNTCRVIIQREMSCCDYIGFYKNINSVHELQHALRLCGIEKDIIL